MTPGQRIKMLREINRMTQERLAECLNVSPKTISAWETGEREINFSYVKSLSEIFEVPEPFIPYGVENDLKEYKIKDIDSYIQRNCNQEIIDKLYEQCKIQMEKDGIVFNKEFLPSFDNSNLKFISSGIFDAESLPLKNEPNYGRYKQLSKELLEENKTFQYNAKGLVDNGLYNKAIECFKDKIILTDLVNCDFIELFKIAMKNVKEQKRDYYYNVEDDPISKNIQNQLNTTLENLNPKLNNFWKIIIYLIDNGAYYDKVIEEKCNYQSNYFETIKDVSKTNLTYRNALDKLY